MLSGHIPTPSKRRPPGCEDEIMTRKSNRRFTSRREFLASTATAVALPTIASAQRTTSPNDRIQIGVIGLGSRGYNLIDALIGHQSQSRIVAICDVDVTHYRDREWGKGTAFGLIPAKKKIQTAYANRKSGAGDDGLSAYTDFRELIARSDIDAVIVATPDHWHAHCTLAALRAGKDVYCEKPVTHLFSEGQKIYREVEKRKSVFQTGSQQRSDWRYRRAVELARNGRLGEISEVQVGLPPGYDKPQGDTATTKIPKQLDYDFWCGPAPLLPYMRARHHRWWRGHRAYGGGVLMDWIGHDNDIAHWAIDMDDSGPELIEAIDWTFPETDVYDTPHQYTIRCQYDGGIQSTISSRHEQGLKLIGTDGWVFVRRGKLVASDARFVAEDFDPGAKKEYKSTDHMGNFLESVRTRKSCIAPAETAHRSITPGHLGYVSHALGRPLQWDPRGETVVEDEAANKLLQRISYREPWSAS
jgi:predicted dehydrogenase